MQVCKKISPAVFAEHKVVMSYLQDFTSPRDRERRPGMYASK
jgi:hypothetical protein